MAVSPGPFPGGDPPRRIGRESLFLPSFMPPDMDLGSLSMSGASAVPPPSSFFNGLLAEFTYRWEKGERPRAEDYLAKLSPDAFDDAVVLIYREFCLAEVAGLDPSPHAYVERFPTHAVTLERLFGLQEAFGSSQLKLLTEPESESESDASILPQAGDEIGPFRLLRELGRGAFARVFLTEQMDLELSLIVLKVSTRVTTEPSLLARAAHSNIVPLHWHKLVDNGAFQIIAMPFLGGTTLSAILADRRKHGNRPATGHDLLVELDQASAPEYARPRPGRPARDAIDTLSYSKAVAWLIARLAEALDHAYGRGVLHGDVKPSNILLTADGMPMLLDFNLSIGWRPLLYGSGSTEILADGGGTLPYMAPERLLWVADPAKAPERAGPADRHRADIYSLGVVLLEMQTGRSPDLSSHRALSMPELASVYASSRIQGGEALIREAHRPVPGSLRAILARCLAPDPADRYRRASELAEDLDAWRQDHPLVHARERHPTQGILRWVRRRKRVGSMILTGIFVAAATGGWIWWRNIEPRRIKADVVYEQVVEDGAFRDRRTGSGWVKFKGDPVAAAKKHLEHYGVLDTPNWREREEYIALDSTERDELEAWLLEQSLRYAHALGARSDTDSHRRAWAFLKVVADSARYGPLVSECRSLRQKLEEGDTRLLAGSENSPHTPIKGWIEEYLEGVAAELASKDDEAVGRLEQANAQDVKASGLYREILHDHPHSFWVNYRFACVAFSMAQKVSGKLASLHQRDAVNAMRLCVGKRPKICALHILYAGCLYELGKLEESGGRSAEASQHFTEASEHYERARMINPDNAETYLSRAFLRIELGQINGYKRDISQYDLLTGQHHSDPLNHSTRIHKKDRDDTSTISTLKNDPDAMDARLGLVDMLFRRGHAELGLEELKYLISADPDNLQVRNFLALNLVQLGRNDEAEREFAFISRHPDFERSVRKGGENNKDLIVASERTVLALVEQGNYQDAIETARSGNQLAKAIKYRRFEAEMVLARAYALAWLKGKVPEDKDRAVATLLKAFPLAHSREEFRKEYEGQNVPAFDNLRTEFASSYFEAEAEKLTPESRD